MTIVEEQYLNVKFRICQKADEVPIESLKELFQDDVDSVRRLARVDDVPALLGLLEFMNIFRLNDCMCMHKIADYLGDTSLSNHVNAYEQLLVEHNATTAPNINQYAAAQLRERTEVSGSFVESNSEECYRSAQGSHPKVAVAMTETMRHTICDMIASKIGSKWRAFARSLLQHDESLIEELYFKHPNDVRSLVHAILNVFFAKSKDSEKVVHLLESLRNARRTDLSRLVENEIYTNPLLYAP